MNEKTWQEKIADLEAFGLSLSDIGKQIGLKLSSVSDLKHGASIEPRGMAAVKLYKLHGRVMRQQQKQAA